MLETVQTKTEQTINMLSDLEGLWMADRNIIVSKFIESLTIYKGQIIAVTKTDAEKNKIWIEIGPAHECWEDKYFLNDFYPL